MAEVLLEFRSLVFARDGQAYRVLACGAAARDGTKRWCGWIEFLPVAGGPPVRTARETTQPNRMCTAYWSTGLTPAYLEGALGRALKPMRIQSLAGACSCRTATSPRWRAGSPPFPGIAPATGAIPSDPTLELTPDDRRFLKLLRITQE